MEFARRAIVNAEENGDGELDQYLDTLALAQHLTGDTSAAIETQRRAVELLPDDESLAETLARYEAALQSGEETP